MFLTLRPKDWWWGWELFVQWDRKTTLFKLLHSCRSSNYDVNHISSPTINTISSADSFPWKPVAVVVLCIFVFCVVCGLRCAGGQCWDQTRVPGRWVVFILLVFRGSKSPGSCSWLLSSHCTPYCEYNKLWMNIFIFQCWGRSKDMSGLIRQLGGEWSLSGFVSLIVINHKDQECRYLWGNWINFFPSIF